MLYKTLLVPAPGRNFLSTINTRFARHTPDTYLPHDTYESRDKSTDKIHNSVILVPQHRLLLSSKKSILKNCALRRPCTLRPPHPFLPNTEPLLRIVVRMSSYNTENTDINPTDGQSLQTPHKPQPGDCICCVNDDCDGVLCLPSTMASHINATNNTIAITSTIVTGANNEIMDSVSRPVGNFQPTQPWNEYENISVQDFEHHELCIDLNGPFCGCSPISKEELVNDESSDESWVDMAKSSNSVPGETIDGNAKNLNGPNNNDIVSNDESSDRLPPSTAPTWVSLAASWKLCTSMSKDSLVNVNVALVEEVKALRAQITWMCKKGIEMQDKYQQNLSNMQATNEVLERENQNLRAGIAIALNEAADSDELYHNLRDKLHIQIKKFECNKRMILRAAQSERDIQQRQITKLQKQLQHQLRIHNVDVSIGRDNYAHITDLRVALADARTQSARSLEELKAEKWKRYFALRHFANYQELVEQREADSVRMAKTQSFIGASETNIVVQHLKTRDSTIRDLRETVAELTKKLDERQQERVQNDEARQTTFRDQVRLIQHIEQGEDFTERLEQQQEERADSSDAGSEVFYDAEPPLQELEQQHERARRQLQWAQEPRADRNSEQHQVDTNESDEEGDEEGEDEENGEYEDEEYDENMPEDMFLDTARPQVILRACNGRTRRGAEPQSYWSLGDSDT